MNSAFKKGIVALSTAATVASGVSAVTNVVEQINVTNVHEINISDVYMVNGEETTAETWAEIVATNSAKETVVTDIKVEIIDENTFVFYAGACDELPQSVEDLPGKTTLDGAPSNYTVTVSAGNPDTEEGQYVVFAVPKAFDVSKATVSGFTLDLETYTVGDYDVFYLESPVYDEDCGGTSYVLTFKK